MTHTKKTVEERKKYLEMILLLKLFTNNTSILRAYPPTADQAFTNQDRCVWVNTMEYSRKDCQCNATFNTDSMASAGSCPWDIFSKGLNISSKQQTGAE